MKRLFSFLIIIFSANFLFAQTENYRNAINSFQTNYNSEKYDEIFNSFSPEMQQALPLENTKEFLMTLNTQAGKIENKEFISYQQGTYAVYKAKFEKAVLALNISLDEQKKINGLFVGPYKDEDKTSNKTINALDSYPKEIAEIIFLKSKDFPNNTQLSIAVIENGKANYYGIVKQNDSLKPIVNQNKVFEIGSITKIFTSTVLAFLAENKKIKLTDNVNSYYPFTFKDNIKLSFESLANHTSGLSRLPENLDLKNETNPYKNYGKDLLEDYLKNGLKMENISLTFSYSNLGAGLLGYTLGLTQKTSFQQLLQKNVFDKYKMTNSYTSSQNLGNQLVKGLNANGKIIPNWDFDVLFGGGGILSTTEDLTKFAKAQFDSNNKELALTRKPTFVINDKMKMGLGWHILKSEKDKELFWHNGGTGGYSSSMAVIVDSKIAVIILSNVSAISPKNENIDKLCFELIKKTDKN